MKKILSLVLAACMAFAVTACGNTGGSGGTPGDSANPNGKNFAHISLDVSFSACQMMIAGMNDELRDGDTLELYNYELDDNKFMEMMEQIVAMNYDGVIIYAKDGDLGGEAANMCKEAGLPATAIDIACTDTSGLVGYSFGSDYGLGYNGAVALAQGVYEKTGAYDCNMLIVCRDTDTVGAERLRGFTDAVAEHPEMNLVYNIMEEWSTDAVLGPIENTLVANPEIDAIWCPNAQVSAAAVQVLEELGRTDDVVVVSGECSLWVKEQLEAGTIYAGVDSLPYDMGAKCMEMLYDYLDGETFDPNQDLESKIITVDNLEESTTWQQEEKLQ